jgi:hypothetical protein
MVVAMKFAIASLRLELIWFSMGVLLIMVASIHRGFSMNCSGQAWQSSTAFLAVLMESHLLQSWKYTYILEACVSYRLLNSSLTVSWFSSNDNQFPRETSEMRILNTTRNELTYLMRIKHNKNHNPWVSFWQTHSPQVVCHCYFNLSPESLALLSHL